LIQLLNLSFITCAENAKRANEAEQEALEHKLK
jgi:hypothetical protein